MWSLYRRGMLSHHKLATALGLGRLELEHVLKEHHVTEDLITVEEYDEQMRVGSKADGRMIIVTDTSPLNYLILIGIDDVLPPYSEQ